MQNIDVRNLIDVYTGKGDYDVLNDLFIVRDRQLIQRVPIPLRRIFDSWFFLLDNKGQFTVRSLYR